MMALQRDAESRLLFNIINLEGVTADPSDVQEGDIWYRDDLNMFKTRSGSVSLPLNDGGLLSRTSGIDGKVVATTNLYTVPAGVTAVVTHAIVRSSVATAVTVAASAGIGVAAGEDDIFASAAMTGFDTTSELWKFAAVGVYKTAAAASVIKLGIDTGATATTFTLIVDLFGYLV